MTYQIAIFNRGMECWHWNRLPSNHDIISYANEMVAREAAEIISRSNPECEVAVVTIHSVVKTTVTYPKPEPVTKTEQIVQFAEAP